VIVVISRAWRGTGTGTRLAALWGQTNLLVISRPVLGVSRPESVPNLIRRFSTWLESQNDARRDVKRLQTQLGLRNN
jgi:hypothetical protein